MNKSAKSKDRRKAARETKRPGVTFIFIFYFLLSLCCRIARSELARTQLS